MSAFARYARQLIGGGYSPVPVIPGTKRPLLDKWDRLRSQALTDQEIADIVRRCPDAGLAVAGGFNCLVPVDIDCEDLDIRAAIRAVLPITNVSKTGKRGATAYFWDATGCVEACKLMGTDRRPLVEIVATGKTIIPPTIHPDTRRPYQWNTTRTLFDVPVDGLAIITPDHIEALRDVLRPWMPAPRAPIATTGRNIVTDDRRLTPYARRAVQSQAAALQQIGSGGRNNALFDAVCILGKFVHHGCIGEDELRAALMGACQVNGLVRDKGAHSCAQTITSGLRKSQHDALPPLPDRPRPANVSHHGATA